MTNHATDVTNFFDDFYADLRLSRRDSPATIDRMVEQLWALLGLRAPASIMEQCCGIGRLSIPLALRGARVLGIDLATSYVETARVRAAATAANALFEAADVMSFVAPEPCDAVINWYTSWGYHPDDAMNRRVLARAFESLRPGGRFLLEHDNLVRTLLEDRGGVEHHTDPQGRRYLVLREVQRDFAAGSSLHHWTIIDPQGVRTTRSITMRMYLPHEIVTMLGDCGFAGVTLMGSLDGEPFGTLSPRALFVATKP